MDTRQKVLLYGDSLVLAGLQASLSSWSGLEVIDLDGLVASEQELCALRPNVVIFDLGAVQPGFHYRLVEKLPDLLLVGIDSATNRVLVWSGQQLRELCTQDLVHMIEGHNRHLTGSEAGTASWNGTHDSPA